MKRGMRLLSPSDGNILECSLATRKEGMHRNGAQNKDFSDQDADGWVRLLPVGCCLFAPADGLLLEGGCRELRLRCRGQTEILLSLEGGRSSHGLLDPLVDRGAPVSAGQGVAHPRGAGEGLGPLSLRISLKTPHTVRLFTEETHLVGGKTPLLLLEARGRAR